MKKWTWFWLVVAPFLGVLLLDQVTKSCAYHFLPVPRSFGVLLLELHNNYGVIFGIGSHLPRESKTLMLATAAGFLFASYLMIQWIAARPYPLFRIGLALLAGGIAGNSWDHITRGYALDFLSLKVGSFHTPVFNLADLIQWPGYGLVLLSLYLYRGTFYPEKESRRTLLINPIFQFRFFLSFLIANLGFSVVAGLFFIGFLRLVMSDVKDDVQTDYLMLFALSYAAITCAFSLLGIIFTIRLSHRIIGPIVAIERFLAKRFSGEKIELKTREGDELAHLEKLISFLNKLDETQR